MSFAPPPGASLSSGDPLVAAAVWLQGTLLGTIGTSIAVIAVAALGLRMLSGRLSLRRGITTVCGCFLLFGAPSIVAGLNTVLDRDVATPDRETLEEAVPAPALPPKAMPTAPIPPPRQYDPYAGAAVPPR